MERNQLVQTDPLVAKQALQELYKESLYRTAKYLCGYNDINHNTHSKPISVLESDSLRKLVVMPRGTFKTSLCVVAFTIWQIIRNPNVRILIDSELWTLSRNSLREIKAHIKGGVFQSEFPGWNLVLDNQDEITINQRTKILKEPTVTASGIGAGKTGQHYDCLHPDTKVWTSKGWVRAKDLREGLRVLTSKGKFQSILAVASKASTKRMLAMRAAYQREAVVLTEDHKLLVFRGYALQWVEAKDVRDGDFFAVPKPKGANGQISRSNPEQSSLLKHKEIWRLLGYWLAEGCSSQGNQIRLSFGAHEKDTLAKDAQKIVQSILKVNCTIQMTKSSTCLVQFHHADFKAITKRMGTKAADKRIPAFAMNAPIIKRKELIRGYFAGDGCLSNGRVSCVSVSENLISGMQLLMASLDVPMGVTQSKRAGAAMVVGNLCKVKDSYSLSTTDYRADVFFRGQAKLPMLPSWSFFTPDYWMVPFKGAKEVVNPGTVYDIQVANTPDFYCQGMIAHNCIIFDDLNSPQNSLKLENAEKVINHYRYYTSILEPGGLISGSGTRYSEMDLIGHIMRTEVEGNQIE